jgi:hypothetical protein
MNSLVPGRPVRRKRLPLRVHTFLAGVPLHDVWSVNLPRSRAGVTLDEFLRTTSNGKLDTCGCSKSSSLFTPSPLVRMLLDIRLFVGRFFGWDHEPAAIASKTFAARLTDTDHSTSLAAAGTRDGFFRVVYRFENEQLVELLKATTVRIRHAPVRRVRGAIPILARRRQRASESVDPYAVARTSDPAVATPE